MLQIITRRLVFFYRKKNRWWLPLIAGFPFVICLPPFNHELHWSFTFFPFLNFFVVIPLLFFAVQQPRGRALLHTYLFAYSTALVQNFWLVFVTIEGLWALIILGMVVMAAIVAVFFFIAGMAFRWCYRSLPRLYLLFFPACWVVIDYLRTLGEISFPWGFLGYNLTPILPVSQLASITGVWGLNFLVVAGNLLVWEIGIAWYRGDDCRGNAVKGAAFIVVVGLIALWGWMRIALPSKRPAVKIALLQTAIDQLNWNRRLLDTSFMVTDSMVYSAAKAKPDLIVGPESALLCFLSRKNSWRKRVCCWADSTGVPILLGALHWDPAPENSAYDYLVFNTAFLIRPYEHEIVPYRKIILVPFSENIPLEGVFPILSRVNLGEADFKKGHEMTVYAIGDSIRAAPVICYEMIYPAYVRQRLRYGVNLLVHITNDGWFGRTTGPHQHAMMARMRSIENGVATARCAITGVSMLVDPKGRVLGATKLGERRVLEGTLPLQKAETFYARYGDWFVVLCWATVVGVLAAAATRGVRARRREQAPVVSSEKAV
ncbi:MAG: apolipoprotein N-acyltransferase [Chitinispirillaceae bacterium]|nr:apolipoprotein N-acyltransferase [Chitinispirillaceae bacterium]